MWDHRSQGDHTYDGTGISVSGEDDMAHRDTDPTANAAVAPDMESDPLRSPCPASRPAVRAALG